MTFVEVQELSRAFWGSRALLTAIELDVFTAVAAGAGAAEVAGRIGADPRATEMLLNALVALGLLTKTKGVFYNTEVAAQYLSDQSPRSRRAGLMHTVHLWDRWSTLTQTVRKGAPVNLGPISSLGEGWVGAFIAAMHGRAEMTAPALAAAVGTSGVRRMLDVGGGSGGCSIAFAGAAPHLRADVLDLPEVIPLTNRYIEAAGLSDRVKTRPGDLRTGSLGEGYDLVLVSSICHMLRPEENRDLFRRAYQALLPGGRVAVRDHLLAPDKTMPPRGALFSLNMLTGTEGGASYSALEYRGWIEEAGFRDISQTELPEGSGLMIGRRPLT
jgi:predicted O-methyltransferase YrrM